ncbi:hypothetical protein FGB62_342g07 [Gracilaria domingensis]|nr:hypothetical protein FGB62_342g07 [Gracilaria domingensis]
MGTSRKGSPLIASVAVQEPVRVERVASSSPPVTPSSTNAMFDPDGQIPRVAATPTGGAGPSNAPQPATIAPTPSPVGTAPQPNWLNPTRAFDHTTAPGRVYVGVRHVAIPYTVDSYVLMGSIYFDARRFESVPTYQEFSQKNRCNRVEPWRARWGHMPVSPAQEIRTVDTGNLRPDMPFARCWEELAYQHQMADIIGHLYGDYTQLGESMKIPTDYWPLGFGFISACLENPSAPPSGPSIPVNHGPVLGQNGADEDEDDALIAPLGPAASVPDVASPVGDPGVADVPAASPDIAPAGLVPAAVPAGSASAQIAIAPGGPVGNEAAVAPPAPVIPYSIGSVAGIELAPGGVPEQGLEFLGFPLGCSDCRPTLGS